MAPVKKQKKIKRSKRQGTRNRKRRQKTQKTIKRKKRTVVRKKVRSGKRKRIKSSRETQAYQINYSLPFLSELRNLVLKVSPPSFPKVEQALRKIGKFKLAVATGIFLNLENSRVDLMVVGDDINFRRFTNFIKDLEAELGVELRYVVLGVNEFQYRYDMFDRFVRDVLESPHQKIINRLGYLK